MDIPNKQLKELKKDLVQAIGQTFDDRMALAADLLRQEIRASEVRIEGKFDRKLEAMKDEIVSGFHDVIEFGVLSQIDGLDRRVTVLEKKVKV